MASRELHVPERNASVERGHDEGRSGHVWVHCSEPGALADGANPAVGGTSIEALPVLTLQDRTFATFADSEVDGARRPWNQRDRRGLVALAENAQRAMAAFDAEVCRSTAARLDAGSRQL